MGSGALYVVLPGGAVVGGFALPRDAGLIGIMLGLPAMVLSPWTAPRGDGDGLWLLVIPILAVFTLVLILAASGAAWLRRRTVGAPTPLAADSPRARTTSSQGRSAIAGLTWAATDAGPALDASLE